MKPMPLVSDKDTWIIQLLEHRRTLFEKVLIEFPEALKRKTTIDIWRLKLSYRLIEVV